MAMKNSTESDVRCSVGINCYFRHLEIGFLSKDVGNLQRIYF